MKRFFLRLLLTYYDLECFLLRFLRPKPSDCVLILRTDNIGDFILWLNSARHIKENTLEPLVLICGRSVRQIAHHTGFFSEIITFDDRRFLLNPFYRFRLLSHLRLRSYKRIVNPMYSRNYFVGDSFVRNISAGEKIGYGHDYEHTDTTLVRLLKDKRARGGLVDELRAKGDGFYTRIIEPKKESVMELERNNDFTQALLDMRFENTLPELCFDLPDFEVPVKDYVVVFIGASAVCRIWEEDKFARVMQGLNRDVVVCGAESDKPVMEKLRNCLPEGFPFVDLVGKTSLMELFKVIEQACLVISNDTSAAHISALVKTPSVVIVPGTYEGRFYPYRVDDEGKDTKTYMPLKVSYEMDCKDCHCICLKVENKNQRYPCISNIDVNMVIQALDNSFLK